MSDTVADDIPTPQPPPRRPRHDAEQGYARALQWSFGLHVAAIAAILVKSLVFPSAPKPYIPTLRVDMVALPDTLKKDLQNLPPTQSSKEIADALKQAELDAKKIKPIKLPDPPVEEAAPDEMVLKPKKTQPEAKDKGAKREKKLMSALDRIKALARIEKELKRDSAKGGAIVKGNQISKGTSLSGDAREAAEASYLDELRARLQDNWSLPVWLSRQNLNAQVRVFIDARGRVRSFRFQKASGNGQFDSAIKKTLEDSQPFPKPPEGIAASLQVDGILVGFPL